MALRGLICWGILVFLACGCAGRSSLADENADRVLESALTEGHNLSDDESQAVSDGKISFEEYEKAVFRYRACMESNGTPLGDFHYADDLEQYSWTVWEEYFDNPGAKACEDAFQLTDMLWQTQVETKQAPQREARRVRIIGCMRTKGADVDDDLPYPDVMMRAARDYPDCVDTLY